MEKAVFLRKPRLCYLPVSLVLGLLRAWALIFYRGEEAAVGLFLGRWLFYGLLFFWAFSLLERLFMNRAFAGKLFSPGGERPSDIKVFLFYCAVLSLGWLPHVLVKYPGALCMDSWVMLTTFRSGTLTDSNSSYLASLLGLLVRFFEARGNADVGLYALVLIQYFSYVLIFAYSLWLIRCRMGAKRGLTLAILLCYLVNPYIIAYHGVIIKDSLYSAYMLLFILSLTELATDEDGFCSSWRGPALMALAVINMYLVRKNGLYVIAAVLICGGTGVLCKKRRVKPFVIIAAALALALAFNGAIEKKFAVIKYEDESTLSLPFQQTARYVKYYGDEVSEEEKAVIDSVLNYEHLANLYDPRIADPVKFNWRGDKEKLPEYFKVWAAQLLRRPMCALSATMEQNYYFFVPEVMDNCAFYVNTDLSYEVGRELVVSRDTPIYEPIFREPDFLQGIKHSAIRVYELLHRLPVTGWLGNVSLGFYAFIFLIMLSAKNRINWLLQSLPGIMTLIFTIGGPVIYGHPRYMFPVIYSLPVLLVYVLYAFKEKGKEETY